MMFASVILVIALSGYFFASQYPIARFNQRRAKGWADYGRLVGYGLIFSIISLFLTLLADYYDFLSNALAIIGLNLASFLDKLHINTEQVRFFSWAGGSILLAAFFGARYNNAKTQEDAARKLGTENEFESMLFNSSENQEIIQITLKSSKVYVGIVNTTPYNDSLENTEYFTIFPLYSGYRHKDDLTIKLTNSYVSFYHGVVSNSNNSEKKEKAWDDLEINFKTLIICSEVVSLAYFDFESFGTINALHSHNGNT